MGAVMTTECFVYQDVLLTHKNILFTLVDMRKSFKVDIVFSINCVQHIKL